MKCPYCSKEESKVIDKRNSESSIRRRRECLNCNERFTTHEKYEAQDMIVVKKDGRKEPFSKEKILKNLGIKD